MKEMSDSEVRLECNVRDLCGPLSSQLGVPADVIKEALIAALKQSKANATDNSSPEVSPLIDIHNGIQQPVEEIISLDSNHEVSHDMDSKTQTQYSSASRKDSLSSVIEITKSDSKSINIKLPDLYVSDQGETSDSQNSTQSNSNLFDDDLNQSPYPGEQNLYNRSNEYEQNFSPDVFEGIQRRHSYKSSITDEPPVTNHIQNIYKSPAKNQQISDDFPQRKEYHIQDTSFRPSNSEIRNRRIDSVSDAQYTRIEPQSNQDSHISQKQVDDSYLSEWPSLSEASRKGNPRKNSGEDLGAWGQMDTNISSAWGKPKRWSSETEINVFEPPPPAATAWNPDEADLAWKPIQEPKAPIKKKKSSVSFEIDDSEGWGAPPTNYIPWNDSRQGYCVDLIEEQKETTFWSVQNGQWINVSEEARTTSEKFGDNLRQRRTTRMEERQMQGPSLTNNKDIAVELSDSDNIDSTTESVISEGPKKRLGNARWKTEEDWRGHHGHVTHVDRRMHDEHRQVGDLISLDTHISDSKDLEEPLVAVNDIMNDTNYVPNWNNWGSIPDDKAKDNNWGNWGGISGDKDNSWSNWKGISDKDDVSSLDNNWGNVSTEIESVKNDTWSFEDVTRGLKQKEEVKESDLLINFDTNSDNLVVESTIINTHPPIFHGSVNNETSEMDFLDDIFNKNSAKISTDVVNNDLLSFEDNEEDNKVSNDTISAETSQKDEKKNNPFNFAEFEDLLGDTPDMMEVRGGKENNNETIFHNIINLDENDNSNISSTPLINTPPRSYRSSQDVPDLNDINDINELFTKDPVPTDPKPNYTATNGKTYTINFTVETPSDGMQTLRIRNGDDHLIVTEKFCEKWSMPDLEGALKASVHHAVLKIEKKHKKQKRKRMYN